MPSSWAFIYVMAAGLCPMLWRWIFPEVLWRVNHSTSGTKNSTGKGNPLREFGAEAKHTLRAERHEKSDQGSDLSLSSSLPSAHFPGNLLEGNTHRQNTMLVCIFRTFPSTTDTETLKQPRLGVLGNGDKFRMLNFGNQVRFRDEGLQSDAGAPSYLI